MCSPNPLAGRKITVLRERLRDQKVAVFVYIGPYSVTGMTTGAEFYVCCMIIKFISRLLIELIDSKDACSSSNYHLFFIFCEYACASIGF